MIEQQFLTTFNNISSYNNTARFKDKKTNLIIDFINGTYQGYLSSMMEPEGVGAIVDDQFNFILCSNWDKGKMNGQTFIKLANQIVLWGFWKQNAPKQLCSFKIGSYVMFIPFNNNKTKRPKKCLICNETKNKMYLVMIERYPQGTQSKRQFSIIIQKIMGMKEVSIERAAAKIDLQIKQYQLNMISYLNYMNSQVNALKLSFKQNELFIYPNLNKDPLKCGMSLGLLLDAKKLCTKSVGMYSNLDNEEDQRESQMNSQNTEDLNKRKKRALNGLGLSKTKEFQSIIGIFKEDMLIKQMNSQEKIDSIRLEAKNFSRNLNGSVVKQLLGHEHMRSMSYQHNYLYFPEIKKVVTMAVQIHKYIDMFERLSPPAETQSDPNQSMHQHHASQKYLNNDLIVKQLESSGSIIDQYPEFKVNLKKDIYYREEGKLSKKSISNPITIEDQNLTQSKRPGFILNRSTRIHTQIEIKKSRSPSQKSPLKLNKKLPQRSPLKTEHRQNKWKN